MLEIFTNPGYLAAAGALVSAPIIIHLINRMRFKRIRWAAMEFLLKAQKRNRRRLIIEQLILLALRCFLVALVGLLVMRFVGFSMGGMGNRKELHVVLIDDTLSMKNEWKDASTRKDGFAVAKYDVLYEKIGKAMAQAGSSDRLMLLPLSQIAVNKDFEPKVYEKLNTPKNLEDFKKELDLLEASQVHVSILKGVKKLQEVINNNPEDRVTAHILTDFRQKDWALPDAEDLHKTLIQMARDRGDLKVRLIDTIHPYRTSGQAGAPLSHDNVGIVDLRAGTRVVGRDMPVTFTVTLANYSAREQEVNVVIYKDADGTEQPQVDFNVPMPIKVPAGSVDVKATFEMRFSPNLKPGETYFEQISARLESAQRGKLEGDHLPQDNVRHAAVEVRDKVPILVIDGKGPAGRQENMDSFFLRMAMISVPGASYEIEYGDELGASFPTKALERTDLLKYPSIFLLNVRELTDKQLANLENYVKEGGGVGFFMGELVNAEFYNKKLYNGGKGLFPVPLKETYFPSQNDDPLKPQYTDEYQVLLRENAFGRLDGMPIFGEVFKDERQKEYLKDLPIKRYFQVPRPQWKSEPGRVQELATLPNEIVASNYTGAAFQIVRSPDLEKLLEEDDLKGYRKGLERHRRDIESVVSPTSEKKASHLANALEAMLTDKGKDKDRADFPNLTEFWTYADPRITTLREAAVRLRDQAKYGDPFVIAGKYGRGKVVAVMTTAGKEWNDWGGGSSAQLIYPAFIWEMQNYLSSQGSEANLTVGTPVQVVVDSEPFKQKGRGQLKMTRTFHKPRQGNPAELVSEGDNFGQEEKGVLTYHFDRNLEPGLYVAGLNFVDATDRPLAAYPHVFNVDTIREGNLARIASDDINKGIVKDKDTRAGSILFEGPGVQGEPLVSRRTDLSESPWLFLLFIALLVAEQALAVHLSFHLKASEGEAISRVTTTVATQKAA